MSFRASNVPKEYYSSHRDLGRDLMADVLRALGIAGGILLLVVAFTVGISIVVVKRGEAAAHAEGGVDHEPADASLAVKATGGGAAAKLAKATGPAVEEISVINILLIGIVLFTLTVLALLGVSLLQHL